MLLSRGSAVTQLISIISKIKITLWKDNIDIFQVFITPYALTVSYVDSAYGVIKTIMEVYP